MESTLTLGQTLSNKCHCGELPVKYFQGGYYCVEHFLEAKEQAPIQPPTILQSIKWFFMIKNKTLTTDTGPK